MARGKCSVGPWGVACLFWANWAPVHLSWRNFGPHHWRWIHRDTRGTSFRSHCNLVNCSFTAAHVEIQRGAEHCAFDTAVKDLKWLSMIFKAGSGCSAVDLESIIATHYTWGNTALQVLHFRRQLLTGGTQKNISSWRKKFWQKTSMKRIWKGLSRKRCRERKEENEGILSRRISW